MLEETGGELAVQELELAPPGPEEVLGHEGAGVVEAVGERVTRVRPGDRVALSWLPWCGECEECLRGFTWLCSTAWPAMAAGGLMDGTTRLSRDGEAVYHYSFLSTFAEACVVPERSCIPIPHDVPFEIAGLVGCAVTTGVGAVWRILGSIYGSSKPERDFSTTLALYRAGRLPLDRLISHRLPLDDVEHAFRLMKSGDALRVILDLSSA